MFRHIPVVLPTILFTAATFGQDLTVPKLLNTASKSLGQFVKIIPLNNTRLDLGDTSEYKNYLTEVYQQTIGSKHLVEIIQNSKQIDTSIWLDTELPNAILTEGYNKPIKFAYVLNKFKPLDKKQKKYYRKLVTDFNSDVIRRKFYYMSRPVFDNSKQFAVVTISNSFEGGMLTVYKKVGDTWQELGNINRWKY